ncbi:hypothetical protein WJ438_04810 [Streptomyces sp. GD-15H]|uniref:hypothetical protein n=1 Tax=Streptomyces sp. GD-15H TaxID=3129112 RepID=UPI00324A9243
MSSPEAERELDSPLEQETGERDVHPEEEGRPKPDLSGGSEAADTQEASDENTG